MLHRLRPNAMTSCSKAPRGLFVLLRVTRIFTRTSISPGPSLRQCSTRLAIRAGRNLPDKEFRYLRTVIVTAAVHRGVGSKLWRYRRTSPFNLPALGRLQPLYFSLRFSRDLWFCKQSAEPFHCDLTRVRRPFLRTYGASLPNSLTKVLPFAWVSSTRLPVSVCGTSTRPSSLSGFSWHMGLFTCGVSRPTAVPLSPPNADLPPSPT